jgi:hypothetical protein
MTQRNRVSSGHFWISVEADLVIGVIRISTTGNGAPETIKMEE